MKIGMKEEMGVANEMTSFILGSRTRSARICAQSAQIHLFSWFFGEKLQLELSEGHENWHERGDGRCQRNDIIRSRIARAQCVHFCAKRTNSLIFMFWGEKLQLESSEGHENWHEGGDGRCQPNDICHFGITRAQRAHLCAKRANPLIFMVLGDKVAARIVRGS